MATNDANNVEDSDMAECDGEKVVTMMDVLQEQQDFEDDANAVLGASDEKNCTYSKGYIKRQALYACLTCCTEAKNDPTKRAGVCLACSLNCHENHELIELYTKRNFRCDCGNPKFNSHPCQFTPDKSDLNEDNKYNQNFSGLYCKCHRPYPDPESTVEDEDMIQCIVCEDWLHASHLDTVVPSSDQYFEMICKACMEKNEFLFDYSNFTVNVEMVDEDEVSISSTVGKLSNGDLNNETLANGAEKATTEKSQLNMDVEEAPVENESSTETGNTAENQELEKPILKIERVESDDVTMQAKKPEESLQISPDINTDSKDETNSVMASEESMKATEDSSDNHLEPEDQKETSLENTEDVTAPLELENAKEAEEKAEQDICETDKSRDFDKIAENIESTETKDETAVIDNANEDEMTKLNSTDIDTDADAKLEEDGQTTLNNDTSEDTKTTSPEHDSETNDSSKEIANLDEENTNKTNITEPEKSSNEIISEAEINEKTDNTESNKTSSDTTSEAQINKTDITETDKPLETNSESEINSNEGKTESIETLKDTNMDDLSLDKIEDSNENVNITQESKENKRKLSIEEATDENFTKKPKLDEESRCTRPKGVKRVHKGATFWPSHFRQKLCTCNECLSMYKDLSVLFLIDPEDTVIAYETLGKERVNGRATQYEKGLEALSSLDRIQQINALTEYNKMKDKLLDFLKSFKDRQVIVKEDDIKAFFAGMKPKREPDGVYFCR